MLGKDMEGSRLHLNSTGMYTATGLKTVRKTLKTLMNGITQPNTL